VLVAVRLLKGISAGFTAPVAMALLLDTFREEKARNRALGTFLAITTMGYTLGLVIGGLLAGVSWRLVLLLPAAVSSVVVVLAAGWCSEMLLAGEQRDGRSTPWVRSSSPWPPWHSCTG
jgi:MFS family permease